MTLLTVEGVYKNGVVELSEAPVGVGEAARVLVTFLPANGGQAEAGAQASGVRDEREALRQAAFARMKKGIPLGGPPYPRREELYDRTKR